MNPVVLLVVVVPGAAIFALLWYAANRAERLIEESRGWPSAKGRVTASRIQRTRNTRSPRIDYAYEVAGVPYKGKRLGFVRESSSFKDCQSVIERYPPDAIVDVWYNPQKPGFSVLERTGNPRALRIAAFATAGIFFFTFVILGFGK
ncbi:DUF3592 domain-containing protein [Sphingomonas soli]|uniref:DUF3592 domain-containing protein n=1 Tax=Sphingomonas soli TaxID=266127 RepID=UPI000836B238|nr:DUF3592 domain-containing protein [Sphingomonas soli]